MDTRNRNSKWASGIPAHERGVMSVQMLVLLVPVIFGLMGFGYDLGRLYLIRGELNQAAQAMAVAAAQKLIGTQSALDDANLAASLTVDNSTGFGNKYNFGSLVIGGSTSLLSSDAPSPTYFATAADALGTDQTASGTQADGSTAKYASVTLTADAPLLFFSFLSLAQDRKTPIAATAVAGISAPLCTACGIVPFAIAALSQDDTTDFGLVPGTRYTLGYQCTGAPPGALPNTTQRIPYLIINRFDDQSTFDESQQLYRDGAKGLAPSTNSAVACVQVNGQEMVWTSATPGACIAPQPPAAVIEALCGMDSRFETTPSGSCSAVTDIDTLSSAYQPDTDTSDQDDYTAYTGNARRVITVAIVDNLVPGGPMTVLGFRQFFIEPNQNATNLNPNDADGRFDAMYIGNPVPLLQGRFDGGCQLTSGPGKVVLHQ